MLILKQSTAIDIRMGPFVDATDGVTPETGITLGAADQAEVLKANGAATVAMAGTFAAVTGSDGWYDYTASTSDTNTVGEVVFVVQDSSACLPVFVRGFVLEEAIYDSLFGASANGFNSSGVVNANVTQISGDATAATNLEADYDGTGYAKTASTIGTATDVTNSVTADGVSTLLTDTAAIKAKTDSLTFTVTGNVDANTQYINDAQVVGDGNTTPWDGA